MTEVTTSHKREKRQSLEEILVIDVDIHLHEKPAEMAKYIDQPFRQSLKIAGSFIDDRYLALPGFAPGDTYYFPIYKGGGDGTAHEPFGMCSRCAMNSTRFVSISGFCSPTIC